MSSHAKIAPRYLTKSRFKLAVECPTKLFYTGKSEIYADSKITDDFLQALAEGGFQVGELAKLMFPGGSEITERKHEIAVEQTRGRLVETEVILYEGAIRHRNLFARVDILRKSGNVVDLIEVKAKSFNSGKGGNFRKKNGEIRPEMLPYLQDVAFQRYVMNKAYPELKVRSSLMMVDKAKVCSVDGLNQKFKISRVGDRASVRVVPGTNAETIGAPILTDINVDDLVDEILSAPLNAPGVSGAFPDLAQAWAESYQSDEKIPPVIGAHCGKCEFRTTPEEQALKSGFHECWRAKGGLTDAQINKGTVLDVWKLGKAKKQDLIDRNRYEISQIEIEDLNYREDTEGLSDGQRQWMQAQNKWPGDGAFYLDRALLQQEMATWAYPLHFIDFETSRVAIPFYAEQTPYSNIAFQFSHHTISKGGTVEHKTQFLSTEPGVRPNYEFVRKLKSAVGEVGTIFMWWPHENTTLNAILDELREDPQKPEDAASLEAFILDITTKKGKGEDVREGARAMVDLCRLARLAFFHPSTCGSSSIKKVLPAVMQCSEFLKQHYSKPIYGSAKGIRSLNFEDWTWWKLDGQLPASPYKLLPPIFIDFPKAVLQKLEADGEEGISEGGAATTAFARLQFDTLIPEERKAITDALLRYCELDTLAMVMIYQAWRMWIIET